MLGGTVQNSMKAVSGLTVLIMRWLGGLFTKFVKLKKRMLSVTTLKHKECIVGTCNV